MRLPIDLGTPLFTETLRAILHLICVNERSRASVIDPIVKQTRERAMTILKAMRDQPGASQLVIDGTFGAWQQEIDMRMNDFRNLMVTDVESSDGTAS